MLRHFCADQSTPAARGRYCRSKVAIRPAQAPQGDSLPLLRHDERCRAYCSSTVRRMATWNQSRTCSASRGGQLGQRANLLVAICQEGDVLVGLEALLLHQLEQPALRLAIEAVDEVDVSWCPIFRQRAADDQLEVGLPVRPVANIAAVGTDRDAALRDRQLCPVSRAAVDQARPLFAEFGLGTFRHPERVLAQGDGVRARDDWQHVAQQPGSGRGRHQRCPAGLQIEPLGRDVIGDEVAPRR